MANLTKAQAKAAGFVPEIWGDEAYASFESAVILAGLVLSIPHAKNKKGDVVHLPKPSRVAAVAKVADTDVTFVAESGAEATIYLNQHWVYPRKIEDIVEVQGNAALRKHITKDAGYALAKAVDLALVQAFRTVNGGSGTDAWTGAVIGSDGATAYNSGSPNAAALTDAGMRTAIQKMDDADVPMPGRFFYLPPVGKKTLLGIERFTEQAFNGNAGPKNALVSGKVGDVYGIGTYFSSLAPTATGGARIALLSHEEAIALAMQEDVRVREQWVARSLATELVADVIFGAGELRDNAAIPIAIPA